VYCGKTADWIWMPFGVVGGVGRGIGVLDGVKFIVADGKRKTGYNGVKVSERSIG